MTIALTKNRMLSGLFALIYVGGGFATGGGEGGLKVLGGVILPLACIWFADALGDYTGPSGSIWISTPTPGLFVCVAGWLLLLAPVFFMIF